MATRIRREHREKRGKKKVSPMTNHLAMAPLGRRHNNDFNDMKK
jgi:hypothetical protein